MLFVYSRETHSTLRRRGLALTVEVDPHGQGEVCPNVEENWSCQRKRYRDASRNEAIGDQEKGG